MGSSAFDSVGSDDKRHGKNGSSAIAFPAVTAASGYPALTLIIEAPGSKLRGMHSQADSVDEVD
jgi:hypothetical protein